MSYLPIPSIRFALVLVGVVSALIAPPWVPLLVMVILSIRYPAWEVPALGLLVDFLWLAPSSVEGFTLPLFALAGLALVWGFEPLRREFLSVR